MKELDSLGLNNTSAKMYVQSFEPAALKRIANEYKSELKLIQLIGENEWEESKADYDAMRTPLGLAQILSYAAGIGPWILHVTDLQTKSYTGLVQLAHKQGLLVHPYTFRSDVIETTQIPEQAFKHLQDSKIDGLFTDQVMPYMLSK